MRRIEDIMDSRRWAGQSDGKGGWLPVYTMDGGFIGERLRDAWAVLTGRATAVQWPQQRQTDRSTPSEGDA